MENSIEEIKEQAVKDAKIKELEEEIVASYRNSNSLKDENYIKIARVKELEEKLKVAVYYLSGIACNSYDHACDEAKEALTKIRGEQKDTDNE